MKRERRVFRGGGEARVVVVHADRVDAAWFVAARKSGVSTVVVVVWVVEEVGGGWWWW